MGGRPRKSVSVAIRLGCVLALAAMLAGCDKCGDWYSPLKFGMQACKDEAPRPK